MDNFKTLLSSGKFLERHSLIMSSGGNISFRKGGHFTIKKSGIDMSLAKPEDYVKVRFSCEHPPEDPHLSSESIVHWACYRVRNDIKAVAHAHPVHCTAYANKRTVLKSPSYEFDCIVGDMIPVLPYIEPGSFKLSEAVSDKIGKGFNAVLLKRHGVIAVGDDLKEACCRILAVERACAVILRG